MKSDRKPKRERYFVGRNMQGGRLTVMLGVDIGSPADRAEPEAFMRQFGFSEIRETDKAGYAAAIAKNWGDA